MNATTHPRYQHVGWYHRRLSSVLELATRESPIPVVPTAQGLLVDTHCAVLQGIISREDVLAGEDG